MHGRCPIAQCSACVAACPLSALALEDEGLTFDSDICDGCALCAPACPEQAIDVGHASRPMISPPGATDRAFLACELVVDPSEQGAVACLNAVSAVELARIHNRGVRTLTAARADCANCIRNNGPTLSDRLANLSKLTRDRGLASLSLKFLDAADWREQRDDARQVTRRSLFRSAIGGRQPASQDHERDDAAADPLGIAAPDLILGAQDRATLATVSPSIDHAACVACGACVEVCEHGALRLLGRKTDAARYEIDATHCTGCALCIDSCEPGAITLLAWGQAHPPSVPLVAGKCRLCSSPFHRVAHPAADTSLCHICATKSHRQKLFQVLP